MKENTKDVISMKNVFRFAGAYIAIIIGSGFATGQEIMQFFSAYGLKSVPGAIISMILFAFIGAMLIRFGYVHKDNDSIDYYKYYFGKIYGKFLEYFVPIFCFMVLVVMISGAGATIEQYFGLNHLVGSLLMSILVFFVTILGLRKMVDVIGALGPLTIIFTLIVAVIALIQNPSSLSNVKEIMAKAGEIPMSTPSQSLWWFSGILYVAYNIVCSLPFLIEMGKDANSRKEAALGGIVGGAGLMLSALLLNLALITRIDKVVELQIPNLYLADGIAPFMSFLFSLILLNEIFNTACPMVWTVANKIAGAEGTKKSKIIILIVIVIAFILGQFPFGVLVGTVYPLTGYIGLTMLALIAIKSFAESKNA